MTTVAAIDRLVHHSVIVELEYPQLPHGEAKKNLDSAADAGAALTRKQQGWPLRGDFEG